ncbi:MAG: hypothetical protein UY39_C0031G0008 [Candidatus Kaiserbacteria bacterium GW2011_GWC2_49_12]|nr:MAG: hypothetical protein UY39_C0031G0008 [Candidatus Kaiserbacteria bacterium GW2011_GWC2_49_12]KKW17992.1 MAG: hypothetical protein UY59_C0019G0003 [Candidatus Kaiserbacteria bacterium GW2011_GWA1_50_28]
MLFYAVYTYAMGIETGSFERQENVSRAKVVDFVNEILQPNIPIGRQRNTIIGEYCSKNGIRADTARGVARLVTKFDRMKNASDVADVLEFASWLKTHAPEKFYSRGNMVYLADENMPLHDFLENVKANYTFWTRTFGDKLFETSIDTASSREGIWKSWLSRDEGYYISLKGGSGSGTFSVDIAIGHDRKHTEHDKPLHDTTGEIWRVGFDAETNGSGEQMFRIIRTGSGHKSGGSTERATDLREIRKNFLDTYRVSPQRLLLFLTLEIAYTLGFNHIKALSTEGALNLSTLRHSKSPVDYSASLNDVGFAAQSGNWHEIHGWQDAIYRDLPFQGTLGKHEIDALDAIEKSFNSLHHADGDALPFTIGNEGTLGDQDRVRLERVWNAFARLNETARKNRRVRAR